MGEIYTVIYRDKDLTVNTALGKLTIDDILNTTKSYLLENPTRKVLWDFERADGAGITSKEIEYFYSAIKDLVITTEERKIAVVVSRDIGYGLSRLSKTHAELSGIRADHFISRSFDEAMNWLSEEVDQFICESCL